MSKPKMMNFIDGLKEIKEGMTVYITNGQSGHHFQIHEAKVKKIGRELISVGRTKFYLESGTEKTEYTSGGIYSSMEAYNQCVKESTAINTVRRFTSSQSFKPTYEQAKVLAELFGINLDTNTKD